MKGIIKVNYNGVEVAFEGKERVNLTDLWRAAGSPQLKDPNRWLNTVEAAELMCHLLTQQENFKSLAETLLNKKPFGRAEKGNLEKWFQEVFKSTAEAGLVFTKKGRYGGGTWANQIIAVSYAGYLSPKLQIWVNKVFLEHLQELANPELAYSRGRQRAIDGWKRQGKSDTWIDKRIKSMDTNIEHRQVLADHGVDKMGFVMCANNINCGILGTTGKKYKEKNGFPVGVELRNCMDESQIVSGMLAEILSDKKIIKDNIYGNKPCAKTCYNIAKEISTVVNRIIN